MSEYAIPKVEEDVSVLDKLWNSFLQNIVVLTEKQRTTDWFLMRMFRFTSTTLHVIINVNECSKYLHKYDVKLAHKEFLSSLQLSPNKRVTVGNSLILNDEDDGDFCSGSDPPHHIALDKKLE